MNSKIGNASITAASQASCPTSCPFYGKGCYAESGNARFTTNRLNLSPVTSPELVAMSEAAQIRTLTGKRPLRLHVVGDCKTPSAARIVAEAAREHTAKHGKPVWTYTHAWREVPVANWHGVSVLASCESVADAKIAMNAGYAAAIVLPEFERDTAYTRDGVKIIPCPSQTRGVSCTDCGLCMNADKLHARNSVIGFSAHGSRKNMVKLIVKG